MKKQIYILLAILIALTGCSKVEKTRTSGTDTIDNTIYQSTTFYSYGFSFESAKLISNIENPGPDITLIVTRDVPVRLILQTDNFLASFYKVGDYIDQSAATIAFDNLKTVQVPQWQELADNILPNQVWIYRSDGEKYTKIRIESTINETRTGVAYGECTFQWVHQRDGSLTFP